MLTSYLPNLPQSTCKNCNKAFDSHTESIGFGELTTGKLWLCPGQVVSAAALRVQVSLVAEQVGVAERLRRDYAGATERTQRLEHELKHATASAKVWQDKASELEEKLGRVAADRDHHERRAAEWQAEVGKLQPKVEALQTSLDNHNKAADLLQGILVRGAESIMEAAARTKKERDDALAKVREMGHERAALVARVKELEEAARTAWSRTCTALGAADEESATQAARRVAAERDRAQRMETELRSANEKLGPEVMQLRQQLGEATNALQHIAVAVGAANNETVLYAIGRILGERLDFKTEMVRLNKECGQLASQVAQAKSLVTNLEHETAVLTEANSDLRRRIDAITEDRTKMALAVAQHECNKRYWPALTEKRIAELEVLQKDQLSNEVGALKQQLQFERTGRARIDEQWVKGQDKRDLAISTPRKQLEEQGWRLNRQAEVIQRDGVHIGDLKDQVRNLTSIVARDGQRLKIQTDVIATRDLTINNLVRERSEQGGRIAILESDLRGWVSKHDTLKASLETAKADATKHYVDKSGAQAALAQATAELEGIKQQLGDVGDCGVVSELSKLRAVLGAADGERLLLVATECMVRRNDAEVQAHTEAINAIRDALGLQPNDISSCHEELMAIHAALGTTKGVRISSFLRQSTGQGRDVSKMLGIRPDSDAFMAEMRLLNTLCGGAMPSQYIDMLMRVRKTDAAVIDAWVKIAQKLTGMATVAPCDIEQHVRSVANATNDQFREALGVDAGVLPIAEVRRISQQLEGLNGYPNVAKAIHGLIARSGRLAQLTAGHSRLAAEPGYEQLAQILDEALAQGQTGKGKERHGNTGAAWTDQIINATPAAQGHPGGLVYQIVKKAKEAEGMDATAGLREALGIINYGAALAQWFKSHIEKPTKVASFVAPNTPHPWPVYTLVIDGGYYCVIEKAGSSTYHVRFDDGSLKIVPHCAVKARAQDRKAYSVGSRVRCCNAAGTPCKGKTGVVVALLDGGRRRMVDVRFSDMDTTYRYYIDELEIL